MGVIELENTIVVVNIQKCTKSTGNLDTFGMVWYSKLYLPIIAFMWFLYGNQIFLLFYKGIMKGIFKFLKIDTYLVIYFWKGKLTRKLIKLSKGFFDIPGEKWWPIKDDNYFVILNDRLSFRIVFMYPPENRAIVVI